MKSRRPDAKRTDPMPGLVSFSLLVSAFLVSSSGLASPLLHLLYALISLPYFSNPKNERHPIRAMTKPSIVRAYRRYRRKIGGVQACFTKRKIETPNMLSSVVSPSLIPARLIRVMMLVMNAFCPAV